MRNMKADLETEMTKRGFKNDYVLSCELRSTLLHPVFYLLCKQHYFTTNYFAIHYPNGYLVQSSIVEGLVEGISAFP
jgi:hypothetical protein